MSLKLIIAPASEPPNYSGIYCIRCTQNGKVYIGSAVWVAKRWRGHREALRNGAHHSPLLQRAWNKYGEEAFEFSVLMACEKGDLITVEQSFIDRFRSADRNHGFNINPVAGSNLGRKFTAEQRKRMSAARLGIKLSDEHKRQIGLRMIGNQHLLGHKPSEETIQKLKAARAGKTPAKGMRHTEEVKALISKMFKGRPLDAAHAEKIANALKGKAKSAEHKRALSACQAKITTEDAIKIRQRYIAGGLSMRALAAEFKCTASTISNVINGKRQAYQCL